jgi:hypothetical protein
LPLPAPLNRGSGTQGWHDPPQQATFRLALTVEVWPAEEVGESINP